MPTDRVFCTPHAGPQSAPQVKDARDCDAALTRGVVEVTSAQGFDLIGATSFAERVLATGTNPDARNLAAAFLALRTVARVHRAYAPKPCTGVPVELMRLLFDVCERMGVQPSLVQRSRAGAPIKRSRPEIADARAVFWWVCRRGHGKTFSAIAAMMGGSQAFCRTSVKRGVAHITREVQAGTELGRTAESFLPIRRAA